MSDQRPGQGLDEARLVLPAGWTARTVDQASGTVAPGALATGHFVVDVPREAEPSQPYFLRRPLVGAECKAAVQNEVGNALRVSDRVGNRNRTAL